MTLRKRDQTCPLDGFVDDVWTLVVDYANWWSGRTVAEWSLGPYLHPKYLATDGLEIFVTATLTRPLPCFCERPLGYDDPFLRAYEAHCCLCGLQPDEDLPAVLVLDALRPRRGVVRVLWLNARKIVGTPAVHKGRLVLLLEFSQHGERTQDVHVLDKHTGQLMFALPRVLEYGYPHLIHNVVANDHCIILTGNDCGGQDAFVESRSWDHGNPMTPNLRDQLNVWTGQPHDAHALADNTTLILINSEDSLTKININENTGQAIVHSKTGCPVPKNKSVRSRKILPPWMRCCCPASAAMNATCLFLAFPLHDRLLVVQRSDGTVLHDLPFPMPVGVAVAGSLFVVACVERNVICAMQ